MHGVQLTVGGVRLNLIPTLRAAITLNKRYGMQNLLIDVAKEKVSAMRAVVEACAVDATPETIEALFKLMLRPFPSAALIGAVMELTYGLVGASLDTPEDDEEGADASKGEPFDPEKVHDFAKVYRDLFEVATGWLGYTPAEALTCTPGEIIAARNGRMSFLKLIFGSDKKRASGPATAKTPEAMDAVALRFFRQAGMVEASPMPRKPPSLRACGCTLRTGETCEHRRAYLKRRDQERGTARQRGYDSEWERARRAFLEQNPLCVRCGEAAVIVDHIVPHRGNTQLFWLRTNWQALCRRCHSSWKQSRESS
ncbi:HNH endonuclease [Acuticoccus yangtzensis]|uniref:HNH endonuclease n=1 Tax=Acuticoccus yangtzensis TaxID=1443441 RepID=UPI000A5D455F|nr:HNH endonuclease [Acuticoccus yangtzensis]